MSVYLLLALVPAERLPPSAGTPGGPGVLAHGGVAALYEERDGRPSADREELLAFGGRVTEISATVPTLPVRFGTVLAGLTELRDLLEERQAEWLERLSVVAGHVEVLVDVRDEHAPLPAHPVRGEPGAGREYLMSRAAARRHAEAVLEDLEEQLGPHCSELRRLRDSGEIRVACLVPSDGVEKLRAAIDSWAGPQQGLRVRTSGPWPPFSFTEKEPR